MTFKQAGFALIGPIATVFFTVIGLAASGYISDKTSDIRIVMAKQEQIFSEVMRRLDRIEKKLDASEDRKAR